MLGATQGSLRNLGVVLGISVCMLRPLTATLRIPGATWAPIGANHYHPWEFFNHPGEFLRREGEEVHQNWGRRTTGIARNYSSDSSGGNEQGMPAQDLS